MSVLCSFPALQNIFKPQKSTFYVEIGGKTYTTLVHMREK